MLVFLFDCKYVATKLRANYIYGYSTVTSNSVLLEGAR